MFFRLSIVLGALLLALCVVDSASAVPYYLTDLGPTQGNAEAWAHAVAIVNGAPQVVGYSFLYGSGAGNVPVVWSGGTPTSLLPALPGATPGNGSLGNIYGNCANGIDSAGDIVGETQIGGATQAFYLPSGGTATILPVLDPGSPLASAAGVSNNGVVAGYSTATDGNIHAFVWTAGAGIVDLGTNGAESYATAVSPDGNTIVGDIGDTPGQQGVAVKWTRSGSTWCRPFLPPSRCIISRWRWP